MRKLMVCFLMIFVFVFPLFSQDKEPMSVGIWVFTDNETYRDRVYNEMTYRFENSEEWSFDIDHDNPWSADIHIILSGMEDSGNGIAWSISYTPIFAPRYTNANVAVSEKNISGMNWVARQSVKFVEGELYIIYDDTINENGDSQADAL